MKYKVLKTLFLLVLLANLSSCIFRRANTDNRSPGHHHYRKGGRAW